MVNVTDVYHLLGAWRSPKSFWHGGKLVLAYWMDRLRGHHRGTRLLLGNALAAWLFHAVLRERIPYRLKSAGPAAVPRRAGPRRGGRGRTGRGRAAHPGAQRASSSPPAASPGTPNCGPLAIRSPPGPGPWRPKAIGGEGIGLAREAGAVMGTGHVSPAFWAPVSLWRKADGTVVRYPHLVWDRAKPGLIAVNRRGERFVQTNRPGTTSSSA